MSLVNRKNVDKLRSVKFVFSGFRRLDLFEIGGSRRNRQFLPGGRDEFSIVVDPARCLIHRESYLKLVSAVPGDKIKFS